MKLYVVVPTYEDHDDIPEVIFTRLDECKAYILRQKERLHHNREGLELEVYEYDADEPHAHRYLMSDWELFE